MGALASQAQNLFNCDSKLTTKWMRYTSKKHPTCAKAGHVNPQKPLVKKNRDRVPPTKCSGATFGVLRLNYKETLQHLLVSCPSLRTFWSDVLNWWNSGPTVPITFYSTNSRFYMVTMPETQGVFS